MSDILLDVADGVATLTLNRPEKRNAVRHATWHRLRDACRTIAADRAVRAVLLTGAGPHFCAGADITEFDAARRDEAAAARFDADIDAAEAALADLPQPTIAAIAGFCLGGGVSLALCCDLRIAGQDAAFAVPAARLGVVYSLRGSQALVGAVGLANAKRIMFTADRFDAAAAHAMGLVDRLAAGDPRAEALATAQRIAQNAPLSLAGSKFILNAIARGEAGAVRQRVHELQQIAHTSADHREATRAFAEKRRPTFRGC